MGKTTQDIYRCDRQEICGTEKIVRSGGSGTPSWWHTVDGRLLCQDCYRGFLDFMYPQEERADDKCKEIWK